MKKRIKSFSFAFKGIKTLFAEEPNARIHALATILAIAMGFYFSIPATEWLAVIFAIGLVLSMESLNSAIENLADAVTNEQNNYIKKAKDLAAAGVLISALAALAVGFIVFIPKILAHF